MYCTETFGVCGVVSCEKSDMEKPFAELFKEECLLRIRESAERINNCANELVDEELWLRPNSHLSSVANLVLHLCGNISQYITDSLGHKPYARQRDMEFAADKSHTRSGLLNIFNETIATAEAIIHHATEEELLRSRIVQGFAMTGIGVIIHVTEHLSYHTGQIAMHTKLLKNKGLGFYAGVNLNQ